MTAMLHDRARIHVQAGTGGDGCVGFRREAHVPRGGPDGGDGGRGGDVVLVCDDSLRDLQSFRRKTHHRAGRGGHGEGSLRHGADGETLVIGVPPGTQVTGSAGPDGEDGDLRAGRWELLMAGQRTTVARGGSGGKGNKRFATPTRQAPRFSERGLQGEEGWLELRLKLLADVGLVGLPNAGKSSLLSRLTRAAPKVADYPFTTLSPVLGVLEGEERQLVVADIPGLIEGASAGAGLGHDFLAHVERTRLLVHVLDIAPELTAGEDADAALNHAVIERELAAHDERLARLPRVLALSKVDLVTEERAKAAVAEWEGRLGPAVAVIVTSSATGAGLQELASELLQSVAPWSTTLAGDTTVRTGIDVDEEELAEHIVFRPAPAGGFRVEKLGPRAFAVRGKGIERLLERYDIENEDAMAYVEGRLRKIGVLRALEAEGFQPGDEIEIAGVAFELDPSAAP
ncbi:MAG TPA: GTPase ObgE [Solirubrobacteraceae bacterium]|nr:GTPase ObgE [Solirubrobacteraceae bacterium]